MHLLVKIQKATSKLKELYQTLRKKNEYLIKMRRDNDSKENGKRKLHHKSEVKEVQWC